MADTPEQARIIHFLVSSAADFVGGFTIRVIGGIGEGHRPASLRLTLSPSLG